MIWRGPLQDLTPPPADLSPLWPMDADALCAVLQDFCLQPPPPTLLSLLPRLDAPSPDFLLTPVSARIAALGMEVGCLFAQHELRARVPYPKGCIPEVALPDQSVLPEWQNGFLIEPKYFSFAQDAPLQGHNPNHRRQWRPHEVLHSLSRFFWHPNMTRFELYLSARLNELLPVVHWYGWDEAFRPTCPQHLGIRRNRTHCSACEALTTPYWENASPSAPRMAAAQRHIHHAMDHWKQEWSECLLELESGRQVETPRPPLNASSDAVGYLLGHWNRLTSWSFGRYIEQFLVEGHDYFSSVHALAHNIHLQHWRLLAADVSLDASRLEHLQLRRILLDAAHRSCVALEWCGEGSRKARDAEKVLGPVLEDIARSCQTLLAPTTDAQMSHETLQKAQEVHTRWLECLGNLTRLLPSDVARALPAQGVRRITTPTLRSRTAELVREGLSSCGRALEPTAKVLPPLRLERFAQSPVFLELYPLPERLLRFLAPSVPSSSQPPAEVTTAEQTPLEPVSDELLERLRWDVWLQAAAGRDDEGERFGAIPDESLPETERYQGLTPDTLRLNATLKRASFPSWLVKEQLGLVLAPQPQAPVDVLAFCWENEVRVSPLETSMRPFFEWMHREGMHTDPTSLAQRSSSGGESSGDLSSLSALAFPPSQGSISGKELMGQGAPREQKIGQEIPPFDPAEVAALVEVGAVIWQPRPVRRAPGGH